MAPKSGGQALPSAAASSGSQALPRDIQDPDQDDTKPRRGERRGRRKGKKRKATEDGEHEKRDAPAAAGDASQPSKRPKKRGGKEKVMAEDKVPVDKSTEKSPAVAPGDEEFQAEGAAPMATAARSSDGLDAALLRMVGMPTDVETPFVPGARIARREKAMTILNRRMCWTEGTKALMRRAFISPSQRASDYALPQLLDDARDATEQMTALVEVFCEGALPLVKFLPAYQTCMDDFVALCAMIGVIKRLTEHATQQIHFVGQVAEKLQKQCQLLKTAWKSEADQDLEDRAKQQLEHLREITGYLRESQLAY